jgi:tartrate dehydrogenase/decarboxylase / D-malate dehydrogenase
MKNYNIALIPGDGIGLEVVDAAWGLMQIAARKFGFTVTSQRFDWSCDYYLKHGRMMPEDGVQTLRAFDSILLGAVGWPAKVPDSVSLHGLLLPIRKAFDLYVNARPQQIAERHDRSAESRRIRHSLYPGEH